MAKQVLAIVRRSKFDGRITHAFRYDDSGIWEVARRSLRTMREVKFALQHDGVVTRLGKWTVENFPEDKLTW